MAQAPTPKSITAHIVISEPDEELLRESLKGRKLSPELTKFLTNLIRTKKWTRKITLPSSHDDVAVALVYTSSLKETGLEIVTELHVFFNGRIIIEEWEVVGENEKTSSLPKEAFTSMSIQRVMVGDSSVHVQFHVPNPDGDAKLIEKVFDFATDGPKMRTVPHPLLEKKPVTS